MVGILHCSPPREAPRWVYILLFSTQGGTTVGMYYTVLHPGRHHGGYVTHCSTPREAPRRVYHTVSPQGGTTVGINHCFSHLRDTPGV